ncbi:MAG: hypothetical protein JO303_09370 [Caulobacteraceae bacterium]|nr:hypothetical protein [Caulobacteraceae bacterium]
MGSVVQNFEFRVQGISASTIVLSVVTRDTDSARAMAERMRATPSVHIDVWQANRYLFTIGEPPPSPNLSFDGDLAPASSI